MTTLFNLRHCTNRPSLSHITLHHNHTTFQDSRFGRLAASGHWKRHVICHPKFPSNHWHTTLHSNSLSVQKQNEHTNHMTQSHLVTPQL